MAACAGGSGGCCPDRGGVGGCAPRDRSGDLGCRGLTSSAASSHGSGPVILPAHTLVRALCNLHRSHQPPQCCRWCFGTISLPLQVHSNAVNVQQANTHSQKKQSYVMCNGNQGCRTQTSMHEPSYIKCKHQVTHIICTGCCGTGIEGRLPACSVGGLRGAPAQPGSQGSHVAQALAHGLGPLCQALHPACRREIFRAWQVCTLQ